MYPNYLLEPVEVTQKAVWSSVHVTQPRRTNIKSFTKNLYLLLLKLQTEQKKKNIIARFTPSKAKKLKCQNKTC